MSPRTRRRLGLAAAFVGGACAGSALLRARRRSGFRFAGKSVVITGGSRGLGLVIARQLAHQGASLALIARDEAELRRALEQLPGSAPAMALACDVTVREEVEAAIEAVAERFGGIDVLINDAGRIKSGPLRDMTPDDFEESLRVHVLGPVYTTYAALPHLRMSDDARILDVVSIGGKIPVPHLAPYCAGKFGAAGFSETARAELRREGILVTTVYPGTMRTGSIARARFTGHHRHEFAWFSAASSLPLVSMDAERAAERMLRACREGRAQLVLPLHVAVASRLAALFPGITARVLGLVNRVLPSPSGDRREYTGADSDSWMSPSWVTRLSDRAALRNNELG